MTDKIEKLRNLIESVLIGDNIVKFGSKEHLEIINALDNTKNENEIKEYKNYNIKSAINKIKENKKLLEILNTDIGIDIAKLE